ncbi:flavin-containing monooxygenase [Scenedesmus sp. PABB004]|nr:flavin-containing monooxygenase [Scenedesmus sp. PABB004]
MAARQPAPAAPAAAAPAGRLSRSVAVIGAGAAGLAALRELRAEGHAAVAFELAARTGGVWVYDEADVDSDPLGAAPARRRAHGSMYRDLRTNLPRELMVVDARRFCGHAEVLAYLDAFAHAHGLHEHVRLSTRVLQASPLPHADGGAAGPRWRVRHVRLGPGGEPAGAVVSQDFDALLVCNGHYSEPNLPEDVPGAAAWPGRQLHSHNYRSPDAFAGQTVVVVGASNSGEDVSREVAAVADRVVVAARSWKNPEWAADPAPFGQRGNVSRRGMVTALRPDGGVEFAEGPALARADAVIYCTGYRYRFPFFEDDAATSGMSGGQHVPGLFRHMWVPSLPTLALIGVPWKVVPFPQFELQARLAARVLSGRAALPPPAEQAAAAAAEAAERRAAGVPLRWTHMMGEDQWEYDAWLADAAGPDVPRLPRWREAMYAAVGASKRAHPEDYRDSAAARGPAAAREMDGRKRAGLDGTEARATKRAARAAQAGAARAVQQESRDELAFAPRGGDGGPELPWWAGAPRGAGGALPRAARASESAGAISLAQWQQAEACQSRSAASLQRWAHPGGAHCPCSLSEADDDDSQDTANSSSSEGSAGAGALPERQQRLPAGGDGSITSARPLAASSAAFSFGPLPLDAPAAELVLAWPAAGASPGR